MQSGDKLLAATGYGQGQEHRLPLRDVAEAGGQARLFRGAGRG